MSCNKCGEAVAMVDETGGTESGNFMEKYECVNGHLGFISGEASEPAESWSRRGQVFD